MSGDANSNILKATMADHFRIPPPHTPIPPGSHRIESSIQDQKTNRLKEFDLIRIQIEEFVIKGSNRPKKYKNVFMQIANLKELMHSGILNADQENVLIKALGNLHFDLDSGSTKIKDLYSRISLFNAHLEEIFPKVKVFNIVQSLKNVLLLSPIDDLDSMNGDEFERFEKNVLLFIKENIEEFRISKLFNQLNTIHETFLYHPRRNYADVVNQINHITDDIRNGAI